MTSFLQHRLEKRQADQSFRSLKQEKQAIDFTSNDYLGFSRESAIQQRLLQSHTDQPLLLGATGSRLISGNSLLIEETEQAIADFHLAERGLIFNSGYDANIGLFSSVPQKGDTIICDELIHASIIDGCRLSWANKYNFKHNDPDDLKNKLSKARGNIFVVTESVFSMDGDCAPLREIARLCQSFGAHLIVDEAHATGIFGPEGRGLVVEAGLEKLVFARVVTFGKALGCHGAIVLGNALLRDYLINFARSFIYTTALPPHSILNIRLAYEELKNTANIALLHHNISFFKKQTHSVEGLIKSDSAIQSLIIPGNENCMAKSESIRNQGLEVKAILHPTVAKGEERLRICLHSFNQEKDILKLSHLLKN